MAAEQAADLDAPRPRSTSRTRIVVAIGPMTVLVGLVWALLQPYRLTFLHPDGESFWWLVVEPPLLVILVGALFSLVVAPGLVEDLEEGVR